MITLGAACLYLAALVAVYGVVAALCGTRGDRAVDGDQEGEDEAGGAESDHGPAITW